MLRIALLILLLGIGLSAAEPPRIWLTHRTADPSKTVINWETAEPSPSAVRYGATAAMTEQASVPGAATLHHVEIPTPGPDTVYHYSIQNIDAGSFTFQPSAATELRVVVIGDLHAKISDNAAAILRDDPQLILSAGDNVPSLHESGREGVKIFSALIATAPELFRHIVFMPVLGNHDKEAHPRGPKPPADPVYDVDAKAFHEFFPLPADGWKWTFDFPAFGARFFALDLQHISDFGTTWQTCHAFAPGSEQLEWYQHTLADTRAPFVFTIDNERNATMAAQAGGAWGRAFRQGSALITGFGTYSERAEWDTFPAYNTHAHGHGPLYKDPHSVFVTEEGGYLLLTFKKDAPTMTIQIKNQRGETLDTREIKKLPR